MKKFWSMDYPFDTGRLLDKKGMVIAKFDKETVILEGLKRAYGWEIEED